MFRTSDQIRAHLRNVLAPTNANISVPSEDNGEREDSINHEMLSGDGDSMSVDDDSDLDIDMATPENRPPLSEQQLADVKNLYLRNSKEEDSRSHNPYEQGTKVFEDEDFVFFIKSADHKKSSKYNLSDHLYKITIHQKRGDDPALLLDVEEPLRAALIKILDDLKKVYRKDNHHQVYLTILDKSILNGLNSGNYALNAPSSKIANWVCAILYNYLKSKQTLTLNESFNVKIKVLGVKHILDLMNNKKRKKPFQPHIYH